MKKTNILDIEWNNLIILDACRFDDFKEIVDIKGRLAKINSVGTCTTQWYMNTFEDKKYNIDYYSANPHVSYLGFNRNKRDIKFRYLYPLWKIRWSDRWNTVLPESVNEFLIKNYAGHKTIIHYIQPHAPFIGDKSLCFCGMRGDRQRIEPFVYSDRQKKLPKKNIFNKMIIGEIHVDIGREAYRKTIKLGMDHVKEILPILQGKTIIISDHGNCFGENGKFGHPKNTWFPCLYEVPCFTVDMKKYK